MIARKINNMIVFDEIFRLIKRNKKEAFELLFKWVETNSPLLWDLYKNYAPRYMLTSEDFIDYLYTRTLRIIPKYVESHAYFISYWRLCMERDICHLDRHPDHFETIDCDYYDNILSDYSITSQLNSYEYNYDHDRIIEIANDTLGEIAKEVISLIEAGYSNIEISSILNIPKEDIKRIIDEVKNIAKAYKK